MALAETLRTRLESLESVQGLTVHDIGERRCGIVSFTVKGVNAMAAKGALRRRGINVSVSDTVSTRIDSERRRLPPSMLRASVHYYNTTKEVETFVRDLADVVDQLRGKAG